MIGLAQHSADREEIVVGQRERFWCQTIYSFRSILVVTNNRR